MVERSDEGVLDRRSYLKAAAGIVGAATVGVGSGSAAQGDHELITVPAGGQESVSVSSGETVSNVVIDITADGASASFDASGTDWEIRNCAIRGTQPNGRRGAAMNVKGDGVVDGCYLGDGEREGRMTGIGLWNHGGHITVRNCYIAGWPDNGIYGAGNVPDVSTGAGGSVGVENCYFRDNNTGHLRIAVDGSYAENCVIHNTNEVPTKEGVVNSRGIWTFYGKPEYEVPFTNCHIDVTSSNTNGSATAVHSGDNPHHGTPSTVKLEECEVQGEIIGNVEESNVGSDVAIQVPSGVPSTPEEAVGGEPN